MALATVADVETRLGRSLTATEAARVGGLLDEADALVTSYLDWDAEPVPVPGPVTIVASRMVARVLSQVETPVGSEGTTQTSGPFSLTTRYASGSTSGGPWMAASDKVMLRPYRTALVSLPVSSDHTGYFLLVDGDTEP